MIRTLKINGKTERRRGVLLLVVLSLLVLFVLAGMTFMVVAGQYRRASIPMLQDERTGDPPKQQLETAMYELLRDTNNPNSALAGNSLLLDKYGQRGINATVKEVFDSKNTPLDLSSNGSGALSLKIDTNDIHAIDVEFDPPITISDDTLIGREITAITGLSQGGTSRILANRMGSTSHRLFFIPFQGDSGRDIPNIGDQVLINDPPFNGTGAGFDPVANQRNYVVSLGGAVLPSPRAAHFLNHAFLSRVPTSMLPSGVTPGAVINSGGLDESWDAADFDNPFLAVTLENGSVFLNPTLMPSEPKKIRTFPSFHRPDLINYYFRILAATDSDLGSAVGTNPEYAGLNHPKFDPSSTEAVYRPLELNFLRALSLRPMRFDHPNFTGSNPGYSATVATHPGLHFDPINGPWDVDNDGDGDFDSVWIDLGFPAQQTSSGRIYKPLFAYLVRDMDGRVNVNYAGNLAQTEVSSTNFDSNLAPTSTNVYLDGSNPTPLTLPRGAGYGPAEINLGALLLNANPPISAINTEIQNTVFDPRYGGGGTAAPGDDVESDFRVDLMYPSLRSYGGTSDYLSPPDVYGRNAIFLDNFGTPTYAIDASTLATSVISESTNIPYEIDPYRKDLLFTDAELERFLRKRDNDRGMYQSSRSEWGIWIDDLVSAGSSNAVTTRSYDVPSLPRLSYRAEIDVHYFATPRELFIERMENADPPVPAGDHDMELKTMMPFEFWRGERMDVNRPWGNGLDDDGDTLIDEYDEDVGLPDGRELFASLVSGNELPGTKPLNVPGNYDNNYDATPVPNVSLRARLLFARHLYCLTMFLLDDRFVFPTADNSISFDDQKLLTARRIAQWAINVVDYRDADLVMTGFEYDTNPYNGWDVDQDLSTPETTERDVVWGCETPVLLLTESLAFHDRRVKDTDSELGGALRDANDNSDTSPDDTDLDQTRIPQGSLFLELYCPSNNSQLFNKSADLFDAAGLNLAKMSPPPPSGGPGAVGVPVWRIAISRPIADIMNQPGPGYVDPSDRRTVLAQMDRASFQPSEPYMLVPPGRYDEIERLVWFTTVRPAIVAYPASLPTGYPLSQTIANTFYNRGGATHIMDGEFKLVIPRRTTYIGEKNVGGTAELSDQKIVYDSTSQSVRFDDLELATIEPAIRGLPIIAKADEPTISSWSTLLVNNPTTYEPGIGLNVSEPLIGPDYYPAPTADFGSGTAMVYDRYATPKDNPFDSTPAGTGQARKLIDYGNAALWTGVHDIGPAVALRRTAYLQRLADPNSAFDPVTNPYLTVDWIPIDLTVFNGSSGQKELALPQVPVGQYLDPDDIGNAPAYVNEVGGPDIMFQPPTYFASRLRGTPATPPAAAPNDIWSASWSTPDFLADMSDQLTDRDTVADEIVNYNVRFDVDLGGIGPSASFTPVASSGQPLPWINSANRPFVSELDLMLVPSSSPDRLAFEYSMATAVGMPSPYDSYAQTLPAFVYRAAPFGHLLNFFQRTPNTTGAPPIAANLSRVFDFLDVPSRFVGTQHHFLSPTTVAGTPQQIGFDGFWAPFNRLSKMREPGKINLNTIYDQNVWNALVSGYPDHVDPVETGSQTLGKFDEFVRSRQGYELPSTIALSAPNITNSYAFDYEFPSVFSKPFAASSTSGLLPDKLTGVAVPPSFGSDSTLLRQSPTSPVPFFGPMSGTFGTHNNPERNPGFAYAGIQRLANMTTTQSNVYAVWITMGYFEVTPWPGGIDAAHPDGLQLGRELGEATGDIERHRAFYLIDRSVPVAFEPGQNHNVDDAVIIRRFIE